MPRELLSQRALVKKLECSVSTVQRLVREGVLVRDHTGKGHPKYPYPENHDLYDAYLRRKEKEAADEASRLTDPDRRKKEADARLAELKVAEAEGRLIPADVLDELVEELLDRLSSRILDIPGSWAPDLLGMKTIREGVNRLRPKMGRARAGSQPQAAQDRLHRPLLSP